MLNRSSSLYLQLETNGSSNQIFYEMFFALKMDMFLIIYIFIYTYFFNTVDLFYRYMLEQLPIFIYSRISIIQWIFFIVICPNNIIRKCSTSEFESSFHEFNGVVQLRACLPIARWSSVRNITKVKNMTRSVIQ